MNELRIPLYRFESESIRIFIDAYFDGEKLVVEGQDLGSTVEDCWGDSDYEYIRSVQPEEVKKLYPVMGLNEGDKPGLLQGLAERFNTNTCYTDFTNFLEANGIKSEGFTWA